MEGDKSVDTYLNRLDPQQKGNKVEEILRGYVTVSNPNISLSVHMDHLNTTLFGPIEEMVQQGESSAEQIKAIEAVKERFATYAQPYLTSAYLKHRKAQRRKMPDLDRDFPPFERNPNGAQGVGLQGPEPGC